MKPIALILPKPTALNQLYKITCRSGYARMYLSPKGEAWFEEAGWAIKTQLKEWVTIDKEVELYVRLYYSGIIDVDAINKALLDLLGKRMKIIEDDKLVRKLTIEKVHVAHRKNQYVEVIINEI